MEISNKRCIETVRNVCLYECLYDNELCYGIEKVGVAQSAVFSHDDVVLRELTTLIRAGATIQFNYNKFKTMKIRQRTQPEMSLAKYLYKLYHSMAVSDIDSNIQHKESDEHSNIEDCRLSNLYCGTAKIYHEYRKNSEGAIILETLVVESNRKDLKDLFDSEQVIVDILKRKDLILEWMAGTDRLLCTVRKTKLSFPVSYLAFLAYYANITPDNYIIGMEQLKVYIAENHLSIEHLDGDYHNHRKYNLALVDEGLNSRKNNKVSRIKEPSCFAIVRSENKFKIVIGELEKASLRYSLFSAKEFSTVVDFLNEYMKLYPEKIYRMKEARNNEGLFDDAVFRKSVANTPISRFKPLDD